MGETQAANDKWFSAKERMNDHERAAFEACERVLAEAKKIRDEQRAWFDEIDAERRNLIYSTIVEVTRDLVPEVVKRRVEVILNDVEAEVMRRVLGSIDVRALKSVAASLRKLAKPLMGGKRG